jgi:hypothetical protein
MGANPDAAVKMTAKLKRTKKDMAGPVEFESLLFRD